MTKLGLVLFLLLPGMVLSQSISTSLDVPALTSGPARSSSGEPVALFDRRVLVQVSGGPVAEFCLYINTRTGDIGIRYGRPGELGACAIDINDERFRFLLIRSGGQVQTYMTVKQGGVLKYFVSTGNTEVYPVSFPPIDNAELRRQSDTETSRRSGVNGRAYRANSAGAPALYLQGRSEPASVTTQDFLGHSGIGYLKTNRGVYMVVRADMGPTTFRVYSWTDTATQLDLAPFELVENLINDKLRAGLDREEQKLRSKTFSGDCASAEEHLRNLQLSDVEARRRTNAERNRGNIYENESTRRAYGELLLPNLEVMNQEFEVRVCKANARLSRTRSGSQQADIQRRINCFRDVQRELNRIQMEWNAIDARYPNDAGRAYQAKIQTYGRIISLGTQCQ